MSRERLSQVGVTSNGGPLRSTVAGTSNSPGSRPSGASESAASISRELPSPRADAVGSAPPHGAANALTGVFPSFAVLLAARVLAGLSAAAVTPRRRETFVGLGALAVVLAVVNAAAWPSRAGAVAGGARRGALDLAFHAPGAVLIAALGLFALVAYPLPQSRLGPAATGGDRARPRLNRGGAASGRGVRTGP